MGTLVRGGIAEPPKHKIKDPILQHPRTRHRYGHPRAGELLASHKLTKYHMLQHPRTRHRNGHPLARAFLASYNLGLKYCSTPAHDIAIGHPRVGTLWGLVHSN